MNVQSAALSDMQTMPSRLTAPPCRARSSHLWSTLQQVCELLNIPLTQLSDHSDVRFQHVTLKSGQRVYRIGDRFDHLYLINSGFLKTVLLDEGGSEQVLSFPMRGDLLGVDGICAGQYVSEAIALSDCDLIVIPFQLFSTLGRTYPELKLAIYSAMSQELIREQAMVSTIASLGAEARIARFLVALSERFSNMGYSGRQFNLRMTRQEIGSYLGVTLETVSRTMSAFSALGLITVDKRTIGILDLQALKALRRLPPTYSRSRNGVKRTDITMLESVDP
jgi:CRP/FNR family transcriptional regulator, anaerobic regulatory protein